MKTSYLVVVLTLVVAGFFGLNSIANSQQATQTTANRPVFAYATLSTQATDANNGTVFTATWNEGGQDVFRSSNSSFSDALGRLASRLGGRNVSQDNFTALLNAVGLQGWRLVESNQTESGTTRVFIRVR